MLWVASAGGPVLTRTEGAIAKLILVGVLIWGVWLGESFETRSTFDITLEMMSSGQLDIGWMVSRRYPLTGYDRALRENSNKRQHPIIKAVFEF